jgi:hypothetical protein
VAIGYQAGQSGHGERAVAIGQLAGQLGQSARAVAIGAGAANSSQGNDAVAIGYSAGSQTQGSNSVAIGNQAGQYNQGANAIAIGAFAGQTNQGANSIIINATTTPFAVAPTTASACYIAPMRLAFSANAATSLVFYNVNTKELTYGGSTTSVAATGTKTFVIDHPTNANKYLVHACLEGPESGVYYRGEGQIVNNLHTTIRLPAYVEHLATGFTIQITPIYSGEMIKPLYTSRVKDNSFTVYGENCEFFWHVTGKRGDIEVEPSKATTTVKGSGPYRWI